LLERSGNPVCGTNERIRSMRIRVNTLLVNVYPIL
jgi:hypothetical protein